ncbi:hypothetical protein BKA62DRAFT_760650 [Auriculariales sp. MPI-PUGE-AT-0066]|nr:hypothetical protein BKA62DRAFT_760650 [Auriculariales sp. MPI-PUGE-AT-0066]
MLLTCIVLYASVVGKLVYALHPAEAIRSMSPSRHFYPRQDVVATDERTHRWTLNFNDGLKAVGISRMDNALLASCPSQGSSATGLSGRIINLRNNAAGTNGPTAKLAITDDSREFIVNLALTSFDTSTLPTVNAAVEWSVGANGVATGTKVFQPVDLTAGCTVGLDRTWFRSGVTTQDGVEDVPRGALLGITVGPGLGADNMWIFNFTWDQTTGEQPTGGSKNPQPTTSDTSPSGHGTSATTIVGIVIGLMAAVLIVVGGSLWLCRRHRRAQLHRQQLDPVPLPSIRDSRHFYPESYVTTSTAPPSSAIDTATIRPFVPSQRPLALSSQQGEKRILTAETMAERVSSASSIPSQPSGRVRKKSEVFGSNTIAVGPQSPTATESTADSDGSELVRAVHRAGLSTEALMHSLGRMVPVTDTPDEAHSSADTGSPPEYAR